MAEGAIELYKDNTYTQQVLLQERVRDRLTLLKMHIATLAVQIEVSRPKLSQYLNGKYKGNIDEMESKLRKFLDNTEEEAKKRENNPVKRFHTLVPVEEVSRIENFESYDFKNIIGICHSCQQDGALGLVVGKSGYGKTYALKYYARMKRVAYVECDDTMAVKDLIEDIEQAIGMPATYGTIHKRVKEIRRFFSINKGYLLIIDEADKLISKYTQKKLEVLRALFDQSNFGMILAGEPRLESEIKGYLGRCANRIDLYWKLTGLGEKEVREYLSKFEIEEEALKELIIRACNNKTGCFRLFDRTLKNVIRIMKEDNVTYITYDIIRKASGMMML